MPPSKKAPSRGGVSWPVFFSRVVALLFVQGSLNKALYRGMYDSMMQMKLLIFGN